MPPIKRRMKQLKQLLENKKKRRDKPSVTIDINNSNTNLVEATHTENSLETLESNLNENTQIQDLNDTASTQNIVSLDIVIKNIHENTQTEERNNILSSTSEDISIQNQMQEPLPHNYNLRSSLKKSCNVNTPRKNDLENSKTSTIKNPILLKNSKQKTVKEKVSFNKILLPLILGFLVISRVIELDVVYHTYRNQFATFSYSENGLVNFIVQNAKVRNTSLQFSNRNFTQIINNNSVELNFHSRSALHTFELNEPNFESNNSINNTTGLNQNLNSNNIESDGFESNSTNITSNSENSFHSEITVCCNKKNDIIKGKRKKKSRHVSPPPESEPSNINAIDNTLVNNNNIRLWNNDIIFNPRHIPSFVKEDQWNLYIRFIYYRAGFDITNCPIDYFVPLDEVHANIVISEQEIIANIQEKFNSNNQNEIQTTDITLEMIPDNFIDFLLQTFNDNGNRNHNLRNENINTISQLYNLPTEVVMSRLANNDSNVNFNIHSTHMQEQDDLLLQEQINTNDLFLNTTLNETHLHNKNNNQTNPPFYTQLTTDDIEHLRNSMWEDTPYIDIDPEDIVQFNYNNQIRNRQLPRQHPIPRAATQRTISRHNLGKQSRICRACRASHFPVEVRSRQGTYMQCCSHGRVRLPALSHGFQNVKTLRNFYKKRDVRYEDFFKHITKYNAMFSMASFGSTRMVDKMHQNQRIVFAGGICHHKVWPPATPNNEHIRSNQILFLEPDEAAAIRSNFRHIQQDIVNDIEADLRHSNPYIALYEKMGQILRHDRIRVESQGKELQCVQLQIIPPPNEIAASNVGQRYAEPSTSYEIAAVYEGDEPPLNPVLKFYPKDDDPQYLPKTSPYLDTFLYPLLHPEGDEGWKPKIPLHAPGVEIQPRLRGKLYMSRLQYVAYRISHRNSGFSPITYAGRLYQQYLCDQFMRIESDRIRFIRQNQRRLFAAPRRGLQDYLNSVADNHHVEYGRQILLPRSFEGSPACLQKRFLDAMAVVRKYGKPDLFCTMTANPRWPEITKNLKKGQRWFDRPDLVTTVFQHKLKHCLKSIEKDNLFGPCRAVISSIEFQKRGLPHAHFVVFLKDGHKITTPEQVNQIISAELPDQETDKELFDIVTNSMLHNLCGPGFKAVCKINDKCTKGYPKPFSEETIMDNGKGRILYKRPCNERFFEHPTNKHIFTNQNVVSYCPYLLRKYNCHFNVDVCANYASLKYIFKYIFKGADALIIRSHLVPESVDKNQEQQQRRENNLQQENPLFIVRPDQAGSSIPQHQNVLRLDYDETVAYFNTRYVSSMEAAWRLFKYPMHSRTIPVVTLAVHDEDFETILYEQNLAEAALNRRKHVSTLKAYMNLNKGPYKQLTAPYTYEQIPEYFVRCPRTGEWKPRTVQGRSNYCIGRLAAVPRNSNLYFIRLLLLHQKGFTSFEELRTINGVQYETAREACIALGLLHDDNEHLNAMREASISQFPKSLRRLLVYQTLFCGLLDPETLFNTFDLALTQDFRHRGMDAQTARIAALRDIAYNFDCIATRPEQWQELFNLNLDDSPNDNISNNVIQPLTQQESHQIQLLNQEQRIFYNYIIHLITTKMERNNILLKNNLYFLNGVGGTGKTYLYQCLCNKLKSLNKTYKCVAWTGVASQLLPSGTTCHFCFGLPFDLTPIQASSYLTLESSRAQSLKDASIIIWDEVSMSHRCAFTIVDRFLKTLMNNNLPFGGKLIVVGGDFHQLLPVVSGTFCGALQAAASPCYSNIWPSFRIYNLLQNRRARRDPEYANYLLQIAAGISQNQRGEYTSFAPLPQQTLVYSKEELINKVFQKNVLHNGANCAILTPRNIDAFPINDDLVSSLPGDPVELLSQDTITGASDGEHHFMPIDMIHDLTPTGLPPHRLVLKVGTIVTLLRNLDISAGLCNGARLRITAIHRNVLECELLTGNFAGQITFLPRMITEAVGRDVPVSFTRHQFPIRVGYAITINRAQGQTYDRVGLYLTRPVFSHGHLYVAMSRVGRFNDIFILNPSDDYRDSTLNVVNQDVLRAAVDIPNMDLL